MAGNPLPRSITIPEGASFADMVRPRGSKDIGDQINQAIIAPLASTNNQLSQEDFPDFNAPTELGSGKEMVGRLTNLVGIFGQRELDFSRNRRNSTRCWSRSSKPQRFDEPFSVYRPHRKDAIGLKSWSNPLMFNFIHAADLHLDSPLVGLSQHDDAPVEIIRGATRTALTRLVDLAIEREVDFLLIAGDLYDGSWKDYRTGLFFVNEMRRLQKAEIPVFLIFGNHDAESKTTKSLELPENVRVFGTRKAETFPHKTVPATIHGQGFATQAVTENLAENYPEPVPDRFNIGLLHTNLGDAAGHGNYAPSTVPQLVAHGYDYWALGHIHLRHVHHEHPHVVYSGNTQGRHINESGAKGCYLVTVDDDREVTGMEFCALDCVRWESLVIDVSEMEEESGLLEAVREELARALGAADDRLLAARIVLDGPCPLHERLHADHARFLAECVSQAADIDNELIWIESLRLKTSTLLDPKELAERDDLTALVLEALESFEPSALPDPVNTLKTKLPAEAVESLSASLEPDTEDDRNAIKNDVAAIVFQAIATSGATD